jgi:hypothetical protein
MNRHIERLVEAAPYTTISSEGRLFTQKDMAEFAETLIKECAEVAGCNGHVSGFSLGDLIKQHFGVEE